MMHPINTHSISLKLAAATAVLAAFCASCIAQPQPNVEAPAPPEPEPRVWAGAAIGGSRIEPFFRAAAQRRVDVIGIGDSNHVYATHGWEDGWSAALQARGGLYGTGLHSLGENEGNGSGIGYRCGSFSTIASGAFIYADSTSPFDRYMSSVHILGNSNFVSVAPGASVPSNVTAGIELSSNSPVLASGRVRFQLVYGQHPGSQAVLRPVIRLDDPPYTVLSEAGPYALGGPADLAVAEFDLVGTPPSTPIGALLTRPGGPEYPAPMTALYMSAENPEMQTGFAYHVLYYRGGHSMWNMANALSAVNLDQLTLFLSRAVSRQHDPDGPLALIRINGGLNDLRELRASQGAGITPGSSSEAYADNLRVVISRVSAAWAACGFAPEHLYFLLTPSHPISGPDGDQLVAYRAAAEAVALSIPRAACVRIDRLTTVNEMMQAGWYQASGADQFHLVQPAYAELSMRELDALARWCPGDWTGDASFDSDDIIQFLGDWERGEADANRDGATDSDDIISFFQSWDDGAC